MASSILHFTPSISRAAAAQSCLRRMLCTAITKPSVNRVAPPWLMLPPSPSAEGGDAAAFSMYSLAHGKAVRLHNPKQESESEEAKVVGSSHGWLAILNQSGGDFFLWNPITHHNIKLPPLGILSCDGCGGGEVSKVILSCHPGQGEEEDDDKCLAAVGFDGGQKLAYCRPGRSGEWAQISSSLPFKSCWRSFYPDFVYLSKHRLFFCLSQFGAEKGFAVETWYLHRNAVGHPPPSVVSTVGCTPILHEQQARDGVPRDRLRHYTVYAEDSDRLFLVTHLLGDAGETAGFDVHRFSCSFGRFGEWRADKLCYMEDSLDGLVMFVGAKGSYALPTADFPELKPNSIYFSGDDGDSGVFDYGSKTVSPCYYPVDGSGRLPAAAAVAPFWFTSSAAPSTASDVVLAADSVVSGGGGGGSYESKIEVAEKG